MPENPILADLMGRETASPKLAGAVRSNHAAALKALDRAGYTVINDDLVDAFSKALSKADDALGDDRRDSQGHLEQLVSAGWALIDAMDRTR